MLSPKIEKLAEAARYDVCLSTCSSGKNGGRGRSRNPDNPLKEWIYPASVPGRGNVQILKILQSNVCKNNCSYCVFSKSNDSVERTSIAPNELADSFINLVHAGLVEGLFLSSGVCGTPEHAMENMIKTADILRKKYRFRGYIHLKIIPGCAEHLIDEAAFLADRLSINMEAPTEKHLMNVAPDKNIKNDILPALARVAQLLQAKREDAAVRIKTLSQTTQFVVGASNETDLEIFKSVDYLYRKLHIFRSYFSSYQSKYNPDAAERTSENRNELNTFQGSPLLREHRLYQCDFLLRAYGFRFGDLVFNKNGNIPLETDPKTAWAVVNPEIFPVEINTASFSELIRVPGIGPVSAERILKIRRSSPFHSIDELKQTGCWSRRSAGWIELNGKTPVMEDNRKTHKAQRGFFNPRQKWLFEELAPEGWSSAGKSKINETPYVYPAQKGKWVNYTFSGKEPRVWCR